MMFTCDQQPDGYCSCTRRNLEGGCGKSHDELPEVEQHTHITVWKDGSWKRWRGWDASVAESDPDWLCTIPGLPA